MNKVGLHACYLRETPYEWDVPASIELAGKYGCDVFEVALATIIDLAPAQRAEIKSRAAALGVTLSVNGGLDARTDLSSSDAAIRRAGIEKMARALHAIHEIGAEIFCGINYTAWLVRPERLLTYDEKQKHWDYAVQCMREVIKVAEDCNVRYCFEIVNRYEEYLLNTAKEGVAFAEQVGSPNAQLLLDTFHMNMEEDNMLQAMAYAQERGRFGHLHAGESNRRIPGLGASNIDWPKVFQTIHQIGYDKYIVMEPFVRMGLATSMNTCVWRDMTQNHTMEAFMDDVSRGISFLKHGLKSDREAEK